LKLLWVGILLALLVLVVALERLHTYHEPFERDITTYAVAAHELLAGRNLYSDVWDHKPPGIHITYAIAEVLAGYGEGAIYFLNLIAAITTLLGLYQAGKIVGGAMAGLWAAAFWAVVSGDLYLEANQPNTEVFLNASLVWAFALWLDVDFKRWSLWRNLGIGVLFALGSLYKPVGFFPLLLWIALELWNSKKAGRKDSKALDRTVAVLAPLILTWGLLGLWFGLGGALKEVQETLVSYNRFIFSQWHWTWLSSFLALWPSYLWFAMPLFVGSVAGWVYLRGENTRAWNLWAAWALATVLAIFQQGNFFHHYYQLWLPVLCLGGGWAAVGLGKRFRKKSWAQQQVWAVLLLLFIAFHEIPFYSMPAEQWSRLKYGDVFVESKELAGEIKNLLGPGETFYEWGNETGLYFWTQCRPPSGVFYAYPLAAGPLKAELTQRTLTQLEQTKPELFIFNGDFYGLNADNPLLLDWFHQSYQKIPGIAQQGRYLLLMRKDGELSKRLHTT
jgi:4-amino-4-deoxy-L-arabinose transferase-like glycosyltransferase